MQEEQPSTQALLLEIERLRQEVEDLKREKVDLEILLQMTAEHSDTVEAELHNKAAEAMGDSEKRLRQFLDALPIGIMVVDAKGETYYTNQRAQALLGKEVVRHVAVEDLPEIYQAYIAGTDELYPSDRQPLLRALKGEITTTDDIEIHRTDCIVPLEVWGTPIFDDRGQVAYAIAAFTDITERKKAETERQQFTNELFEVNFNLENALDAELELTDAYGRFVPHQFLHFLGYESIVDVKLGDQVQREMSVLFADIRDFTSLSETMTPEENFRFINAYLSRMEPAITGNSGFIDKYIGDAIMALFGGCADDAVQAGITMLNTLATYNQSRHQEDYPPIRIGVGINTGTLMLGTVGGQNRMDSTVISDAVNLAARIEGLTKEYGVPLLISQHTFLRLQDPGNYAIRIIDQVQVRGKSELVTIYEVFDADPAELRENKLRLLNKYSQAMQLYNQKELKEAGRLFEEYLRQNSTDKVARIYLKRCRDWRSRLEGL